MSYKYNERESKITEITGLGLIKDCHACLVLQDLCYLHQQYGEGKSYPLTSPIEVLKDGEVAEENVHFKLQHQEHLPFTRDNEYSDCSEKLYNECPPEFRRIVAIPLNKEEPLPIEEELTNEQIKIQCEDAYKQIKYAEDKLKELRSICKHEETFEGNYAYRVGDILKATICLFCNKPIKFHP